MSSKRRGFLTATLVSLCITLIGFVVLFSIGSSDHAVIIVAAIAACINVVALLVVVNAFTRCPANEPLGTSIV
jgi:hypothetical protein